MELWSDDDAESSVDGSDMISVRSPLLAPRSSSLSLPYSPRHSIDPRLSPSWDAVARPRSASLPSFGDESGNVTDGEDCLDEEGEEEDVEAPPTDGRYAWFLCFCAFLVHFSVFGFLMGFGVFVKPIAEEFGVGTGTVAWAMSISQATMLSIGFFTGLAADRVGPRWIVFTGGLLTSGSIVIGSLTTAMWQMLLFYSFPFGFGLSFCILPTVSAVNQWFEKYRALASGLTVAGTGMGTLVYPLLGEYLLERHGWRWTFRICAEGMAVVVLICALVIKRRTATVKGRNLDITKYFKEPYLWILMTAVFCVSLGYMVPYVHVITYAEEQGIAALDAAVIVSTMGLTSTAGRVGMGLLADRLGRLSVMRISCFFLAMDALFWYFCTTFGSLLVFGGIYGFFSGAIISILAPLCAEFFGLDSLTAMMGIVFSGAGVGMLLGPPVAGYTFDITDSYNIAIVFSASTILVGFAFFLVLRKPQASPAEALPCTSYGSVRIDSGSGTYLPAGSAKWKPVTPVSSKDYTDDDSCQSTFSFGDLVEDNGVP